MSCSVKFVRNLTSSEVFYSLQKKYGQDIAMRIFLKFKSSGYERFGQFLNEYTNKYENRKLEKVVRDSFDKTLEDTSNKAGDFVLFTTPRLITKGRGKGKYSSYIYSGNQLIKMKNHLIKSAIANQEIEDELQGLEESPLEYNDYQDNANFMISVDSQYELIKTRKEEELSNIEKYIAQAKSDNNTKEVERLNEVKLGIEKTLSELKSKPNFSDIMSIMSEDTLTMEELLNKPKLSLQDLGVVQHKMDFWLSDVVKNAFFEEEDKYTNGPNFQAFQKQINEIDRLRSKWSGLVNNYFDKVIKEVSNKDYSVTELEEMKTKFKEINVANSLFRGTSTDVNEFIQIIDYKIKEANEVARQSHLENMKVINEETEKLIKKVGTKNPKELYKLFLQLDKKGNPTGQLTNIFSQNFFDEKRLHYPKDWNNKYQVKKWYTWLKDNTITFDDRKLFYDEYLELEADNTPSKFTQAEIDNHIKELKETLGEKSFKYYYDRHKKKFEDYKYAFEQYKESLEGLDSEAKLQALNEWRKQYSPFLFNDKTTGVNLSAGRFLGYDSITSVPRRFKKGTNTSTGWYDSNFDKIQSDDTYYNYYNFLIDTFHKFKKYYPSVDDLQVNYLPELRESAILKKFFDNPKSLTKELYDFFIKEVSENEIFQNKTDVIGNLKRSLPVYMMSNNMAQLNQAEREVIADKAAVKYPNRTSLEFLNYKEDLEYQAIQKKLSEKSFDLYKILAANSLTAETYKHKTRIEDLVKLSKDLVLGGQRLLLDGEGNTSKGLSGAATQNKGLGNLQDRYLYTIDHYFGLSKEKKPGKQIAKDKESKALIEGYLKDIEAIKAEPKTDENVKKIEQIQKKINSLQTTFVASNAGDLILKYLHVKSLGWNPFSAITNLGFGTISNFTHASGGEDFDETQLLKAYKLLLNNVLKSTSLNLIETDTALKISQLMMEYGVVGDIREGTGSNNISDVKKKFEVLLPYQMTSRAEFLNQGATFLAMMMHNKVTALDGKKYPLLDAYKLDSKKNLVWNTEKFGEQPDWETLGSQKTRFKLKVEAVKKIIHGNYDPNDPVLIKKTLLGRAFIMFRSWVAEGIAARFENQYYNTTLDRQIKGRYRSITSSVDKDGNKVSIGKSFKLTLQEMARIMTKGLYNSKGVTQLSTVDKANLQKNAMELNIYLSILALTAILKHLNDGDDDEESTYYLNFLLNSINRMQDDINFYSNPITFEKLQRNAIPATQFIVDIAKVANSTVRYINGEDGLNNSNTLFENSARVFPLGFPFYRTEALLEEVQN